MIKKVLLVVTSLAVVLVAFASMASVSGSRDFAEYRTAIDAALNRTTRY